MRSGVRYVPPHEDATTEDPVTNPPLPNPHELAIAVISRRVVSTIITAEDVLYVEKLVADALPRRGVTTYVYDLAKDE